MVSIVFCSSMDKNWVTCMYLLDHQDSGADTYEIQCKDSAFFPHIGWMSQYHGRHVLSASLIPDTFIKHIVYLSSFVYGSHTVGINGTLFDCGRIIQTMVSNQMLLELLWFHTPIDSLSGNTFEENSCLRIGWGTIYITLSGNWVSQPPMQIDNPGLMEKGFPFAKVLNEINHRTIWHIHGIWDIHTSHLEIKMANHSRVRVHSRLTL